MGMSEQKLKAIANRINKIVGSPECKSDKLEDLVASIEQSVQSLSAKVLGPSGSSSSAVPSGASQAFDAYVEIIEGPLQHYLKLSKQVGGLVASQSSEVEKAFMSQKDFLSKVVQSKEPDSATLQALLAPLSQSISAIQDVKEKNRAEKVLFNHIAAVSEGIPALGWVTVSPKPAPYVMQMKEAAEFYSNRVLKDYKDKDQTHKEWSQSFPSLIASLQEFVKKYYTTGLTWGGAKIVTSPAPVVSTPAPATSVPARTVAAPVAAPVATPPKTAAPVAAPVAAPTTAKKPEEKPKVAAAAETPKQKELSAQIEKLEKNDPQLKELNISGNEACNPEYGIRIGRSLKNNTHIQKLLMSSTRQNAESAVEIAKGIKENKSLEVFHIETNDIGVEGTLAFAGAIKSNTSIVEWKMANQAVYAGLDAERALAAAFDSNQTITKFTFHNKDIGVNSIIDRALSRNSEIARQKKRAAAGVTAPAAATSSASPAATTSTTAKAPVKEAPVGQMAKIISRLEENDPTLVDVELSKNAVCNAKHGIAIGRVLAKNTVVKKLLLDGTMQDNESAIEIANGLKQNKSLEILSLEENDIGPDGMKAIAEALAENTCLLELRLRSQKKPAGVEAEKAFANAMEKNESLIKFSCQFKDPGVMNYVNRGITRNTEKARQKRAESTPKISSGPHMTAIQNAINNLKKNDAHTTEINLTDNLVCNVQFTTEIAAALEKNTHIKKLLLDNAFQNSESVSALAKALKVNKSLELLSLEHNDIGPEGFKALAEALTENQSLTELKLNHQKKSIGNEAERAIAESLDKNKTLTKLSITVKDIGARSTIDRILARNTELARSKRTGH